MVSCEAYGPTCLTGTLVSGNMIIWAMPWRCILGTLSKYVLVLTEFVPLTMEVSEHRFLAYVKRVECYILQVQPNVRDAGLTAPFG